MTERSKILEGVFAISKPPSLSSAQVLRDLQNHFHKSNLFAPLLTEARQKEDAAKQHQRKKRRHNDDNFFKMGHGGTLDPLATGVLIVGIGRGTKYLSDFLGCTKQYDTVVLFGKTTDTYDICGKIVGEASYTQITKDEIEKSLAQFRGDIKQVPPLYSALKINGMKAYEYARSGKELPRELESRDMKVEECKLIGFYEGGQHEFRWPVEEASEDDKAVAQKLMHGKSQKIQVDRKERDEISQMQPNKDMATESLTEHTEAPTTQTEPQALSQENPKSANAKARINSLAPAAKAALHTHALPELTAAPAPAPAVRATLSVSSGFYVRSFAHDLGIALQSYGIMAELVRSRQGIYTIADPTPAGLVSALTYTDLEAGEDVWGPKLASILESWMHDNPAQDVRDKGDDRDRPERSNNYKGNQSRHQNKWDGGNARDSANSGKRKFYEARTRRNSSSPE